MKIYTRGGDKGRTGIHGGERVDKDDIRIEANGTLDEVNAEIGIIRALLPAEHEWQSLLGKIQMEMMAVMSHVATPSAIRDRIRTKYPMIWFLFVRNRSMLCRQRWRITVILSCLAALWFLLTCSWPVRSYAVPNVVCGR